MASVEKKELLEFEILKHVEETPRVSNRMIASKLGCSVKLAHALLGKMVQKGLLHITKHHARRWDYFLTPRGLAEKTRLTYEFLEFSMSFYQEARKLSSQLCRDLAEDGVSTIAFLGASDLAEIVYLGVKEWSLELIEVYGEGSTRFLGIPVAPLSRVSESNAEAIIVCLYDKKRPETPRYLPENLPAMDNMYWVLK